MVRTDYIVLAIGVSAMVIAITVGAVLYQPPPQADIRLVTNQESYRLGQRVDVRLENRGPFILCTPDMWPWSLARQVGDEWQGVGTITVSLAEGSIWPGQTVTYGWVAENEPFWEESGFAQVLPGQYRFGFDGWLCGDNAPEPRKDVSFYAYFELV